MRLDGGEKKSSGNLKGVGLIEVLVAVAIIGLALASLMTLTNFALAVQAHFKQNLIAANLAVEAIEAAAAVKSDSWSNISSLTAEAPYHLVKSGSPLKWSFGAGAETIGSFSREVKFSQVGRNGNDDIVASGGAPDSDSRKVAVSVSWSEKGKNYQVLLNSYLMNW